MSTNKNKERKEQEKKHINEKIQEIQYEGSIENPEPRKPSVIDEILKQEEKFIKSYGRPEFIDRYGRFEIDNQILISMIECDLLGLNSSEESKIKGLSSKETTAQILKKLPQIPNSEKIKIITIGYSSEKPEDDPFALLSKCKKLSLEELNLYSSEFSIIEFGMFFESERNIESLKKLSFDLYSGKKYQEIFEKLKDCAKNLKSLEFIKISGTFYSETPFAKFFSALEKKIKIEIHFSQLEDENALDFKNFQIPKPHELESLVLQLNLDDEKLRKFFDKIEDKQFLKRISLYGMSSIKEPFFDYLNNLKCLNSFSMGSIRDMSLDILERFLKSTSCENLESLEVEDYYRKFQVKTLIEILSSKPKLKALQLSNLKFFKSDDWLNLFKSENFKNVTNLSVYGSSEVSIHVLEQICCHEKESFSNLEHIDLDSTKITDEAINLLANLKKLKSVDLSNNKFTFKDKELSNFVKNDHFKEMEQIYFHGMDFSKLAKELNELTEDINMINIFCWAYKNEDALQIIQNPHLKNFDFQNMLRSLSVGNSYLKALVAKGDYLKKIKYLNVIEKNKKNESEQIKTETIVDLVKSECLNPFFKKNSFLNQVKDEVTNEVLKEMSANPFFMRFLFELNLKDYKQITVEGVSSILQSQYISQYFDVSSLLQSLTSLNKKEDLLQYLDRFTLIKKLDISGYSLKKMNEDNHQFFNFFNRSKFPNLRDLNLSNTELDNNLLDKLFPKTPDSVLNNLLYLSLAFNGQIKPEAFDIFFGKIKEDNKLMGLDLDGCAIENDNLQKLSNSNISKNLEFLSINKCGSINHIGIQYLLNLHNDKKKLKFMNIYKDYKGLIKIDKKDKKFTICKPTCVHLYKIQKILVNNYQQKLTKPDEDELENLRYSVTDGLLKEFLNTEPRIKHFHTLDFTKCPISSASLKAIAEEKKLTKLTCLKLNKTLIDDEGVDHICKINNLKVLEIKDCTEITKASIKFILNAKNFHPEFNPESILRAYAQIIDQELLDDIARSNYRKKIKVLSLKENRNLTIECLDKLLDLEKDNQNLDLDINLNRILENHYQKINDDLLKKLCESKILRTINSLQIDQPRSNENSKEPAEERTYVTKDGLLMLIKSEYLSEEFELEELISQVINLIDDEVLKAISKSKPFPRFQYTPVLKNCNKSKTEEKKEKDKANEEEKKNEKENEEEKEKHKNQEPQKKKITADGLWHLSLSPNEHFEIQKLINDFGDMVTSSFIKNMVQQPYFKKIQKLDLSTCIQPKDDDLCLIIKASNEKFDLEQFISEKFLPKNNLSLVTNDVLKAISKSAYIRNKFNKPSKSKNFSENDFKRFNFAVKIYPKLDYAINYLIQAHASQIRHYATYLESYTAYLSSDSLEVMRNDIINYQKFHLAMIKKKNSKRELEQDHSNPYVDEEKIGEALSGIKTLKFSTNKYIYDHNIKASLVEAFENFQNQNDLNLDNETIKYYVKEISKLQAENNSPASFDQKHQTLLDLIKECQNLEIINLDNLNLGDDFLKKFSIYISESSEYLKNLKTFEIKNNHRITSVGLKYLYCSIISRTSVLETITVKNETIEKTTSDINTFVSTGLKGMIDNNIAHNSRELKEIYKECYQNAEQTSDDKEEDEENEEENKEEEKENKKKEEKKEEFIDEFSENKDKVTVQIKRPIKLENMKKDISNRRNCWKRFKTILKFLIVPRTIQILGIYFLIFPVLIFHYSEKLIFQIPKEMSLCVDWMKSHKPFNIILNPFISCWRCFEKLYDCFGNCIKIGGFKSTSEKNKEKKKKAEEEKNEQEKKLKEEEIKKKNEEDIKQGNTDLKEAEVEKKDDEIEKKKELNELQIDIMSNMNRNKVVPEKSGKKLPTTPGTSTTSATNKEKLGFCQKLRNRLKAFCSFLSCIKIQRKRTQPFREELRTRYGRCQKAIEEEIKKENANKKLSTTVGNKNESPPEQNSPGGSPILKDKEGKKTSLNLSSYFYFDESLIELNNVLFGSRKSRKDGKTKTHSSSASEEKSDEIERLLSPSSPPISSGSQLEMNKQDSFAPENQFFMVSKMKWIILMDFIVFYILVIFYLLYIKLILDDDATLFMQIPYFIYGFLSFLLELALCWEVTSIINNEELISMYDSTIISNLITSQTAKYDTFTNFSFVLTNLVYNHQKKDFETNSIFIASIVLVGINILLNFKNFFSFFWKNFFSQNSKTSRNSRRTKYHSSENINRYSKLCFQFEFQSLGRLLDKFSTNSAKKYGYWFLPKMLYNVYIPTIITATFARLFLEDFPLLIIQLYVAFHIAIFNFTNMASLCSTILALFLTLHTAWNVKPSIFNRELFEKYLKQTIDVKRELQKELQEKNANSGKNNGSEENDGELGNVEKELEEEEEKRAVDNFDLKILATKNEENAKEQLEKLEKK